MNRDSDNLDRLRKAWLAMGKSLDMDLKSVSLKDLTRKKTTLERLRGRYGRFCIVGVIMMVNTLMIFSNSHIFYDADCRLELGVAYSVYFLVAFCMDLWLWHGIGEINPITMSVSEVARRALLYRRRHIQFMAILIPYAVVMIAFTGYAMSHDKYFLVGVVAGAIIGLAIGTVIFLKTMADYKRLSE